MKKREELFGLEMSKDVCLCELMYCEPDRKTVNGKVETKGGILLNESVAKKHDVAEYSSHPLVGVVVGSGIEGVNVGDVVLLPSRVVGRLEILDHLILGSKDYYVISEGLAKVRVRNFDLSNYKLL